MAAENADTTTNEPTNNNSDDSNIGNKESFTKEDVERLLSQSTREIKRQNEKLQSDLSNYAKQAQEFADFQRSMNDAISKAGLRFGERGLEVAQEEEGQGDDFLEEYSNPPKGVPASFWKNYKRFEMGTSRLVEQLAESNKTQEERVNELLKAIEQERSIRTQAEQRARESERNTLLDDALVNANAIDMEGGRRYFKEQTVWVDGRGWMFVPPDARDHHDYIPVKEGVKKFIPPYLQKAATNRGGSNSNSSGSSGGGGDNLAAEISLLEKQMADLQKNPSAASTTRYMALRRQHRELIAKVSHQRE